MKFFEFVKVFSRPRCMIASVAAVLPDYPPTANLTVIIQDLPMHAKI